MAIKAVLFDHDGTLVDSEPVHSALWQQVLEQYGVVLTDEQYRNHYAGVPTVANAKDIVERFSLNESADVLVAKKNAATQAYLKVRAFPLMRGVKEVASSLSRHGLKLAIVTGASKETAQATLDRHSLSGMFSMIVSSDEVAQSKPAPDCYLLALKQLEVHASECVAIEDTEHGMRAAVGAGISCIALPTAMSRNHDFTPAVAVLSDLGEALEYLEKNHLRSERWTRKADAASIEERG